MILSKHFSKFLFLFLLPACGTIEFTVKYSGTANSGKHSRGMEIKTNDVLVAGAGGYYSLLSYSGTLLLQDSVENAEDFRDVHRFENGDFLLMNSGNQGEIWKFFRQGERRKVFDSTGIFLDGMSFWDEKNGMAYGDPTDGKFFILSTQDAGESWKQVSHEFLPYALPNEAGFAASGTGIQCVGDSVVFIGTGACDTARIYRSLNRGKSWEIFNTPMTSGESFGIYSMYFWSEKDGMIIGGSYLEKEHRERICFVTHDGGESWFDRSDGLGGYCSGIHGTSDGSLIVATGRMGTFYSTCQGKKWKKLVSENYYTVRVSDQNICLVGAEGQLKILEYYKLK